MTFLLLFLYKGAAEGTVFGPSHSYALGCYPLAHVCLRPLQGHFVKSIVVYRLVPFTVGWKARRWTQQKCGLSPALALLSRMVRLSSDFRRQQLLYIGISLVFWHFSFFPGWFLMVYKSIPKMNRMHVEPLMMLINRTRCHGYEQ